MQRYFPMKHRVTFVVNWIFLDFQRKSSVSFLEVYPDILSHIDQFSPPILSFSAFRAMSFPEGCTKQNAMRI